MPSALEGLFWFQQNWVDLFQTAGIVVGFLFTGFTIREDMKSRKISNQLAFKQEHREIWSELYTQPELSRVKELHVNTNVNPVTEAEKLFIKLLVVHLDAAYRAGEAGMFMPPEAFRNDVKGFFSLPIPSIVWEELKPLQDPVFAEFVEGCRNLGKTPTSRIPLQTEA